MFSEPERSRRRAPHAATHPEFSEAKLLFRRTILPALLVAFAIVAGLSYLTG